jgi:hypothetical protein
VCCVNFCKLLAIIYTVYRFVGAEKELYPLTLLGDTLASFLESPDHTTVLYGLATREEIRRDKTVWEKKELRTWSPSPQRWYRSSTINFRSSAFFVWVYRIDYLPAFLMIAQVFRGHDSRDGTRHLLCR